MGIGPDVGVNGERGDHCLSGAADRVWPGCLLEPTVVEAGGKKSWRTVWGSKSTLAALNMTSMVSSEIRVQPDILFGIGLMRDDRGVVR